MKFFVWLFFLLIGGGNLWAAGPKYCSSVLPLLMVTGEIVMEVPNLLLSAIIGI